MGEYKSFMTISKIKSISQLQGRYEHDYRIVKATGNEEMDHIRENELRPNVDPARSGLNDPIVRSDGYDKDFKARLAGLDYYQGHRFRSNGVMAYDIQMTFTHGADKAKGIDLEEWKQANLKWLRETFNTKGQAEYGDNVISVVCHMDEATPHIHAVVLPVDENGRFNAQRFTGDRYQYINMQNTYGKLMHDKFGLERGLQGSTMSHRDIRKMYAEANFEKKNITPLHLKEGESIEAFEARVKDEQEKQALAMHRERESWRSQMSRLKQEYMSDPQKDIKVVELTRKVDQMAKERDELVREFGDMRSIRKACAMMDDLRYAMKNHPDRQRMAGLGDTMADAIAWSQKKRNSGKKKELDREIERDERPKSPSGR